MDNQKLIIIGIIILVFIFIIYSINLIIKKNSGHKILYKGYDLYYGDNATYIGNESMEDSLEHIKYTFSIWIRTMNLGANTAWDTNANKPKTILYNNGSPNIMYLRKDNIIQIQFMYRNNDGIKTLYNLNLENIEGQNWINLIITVNDRKVNIYKNGELYKSKLLPNVNIKSYKILTIGENGNNFNGYIGNLEYFNYDIDDVKALKLYNFNKNKYPKKLLSYEESEYLKTSDINFFS
tara:strand:+ start:86 stop:796 length:711 start_codon:yes stop_codon:yes gene_type:complete